MTKPTFVFLFILIAGLYSSVYSQGVWTQKADLGGAIRTRAIGFSFSDAGYIGLGYDGVSGPHNDLWRYNPVTNTWTQKVSAFGMELISNAVAFSIGNKGYMGTSKGTSDKEFWEYDTTANVWTQKADFGGIGRLAAIGFSIGNKGYIGMGNDVNGNVKDFWEYDPGLNSWAQKSNFGGTARSETVGFSIGNKGYIGTGQDNTSYTKDFWEYDLSLDTWTQKADFGGTERYGATGFSIGSKGYIGTGRDLWSTTYLNDFWEYDPSNNSWTQKADFDGSGRIDAVGFSIGTKGYIGTGFTTQVGATKDFWEYDPNAVDVYETKKKDMVSVFPNPFHDCTSIEFDTQNSFPFNVTLMNISGMEVQKRVVYSNSFRLLRESLPAGVYFLKISDINEVLLFSKKIVIN